MSLLQPYTTDGKVQLPPPPVFEEDASYEVEHVISHEDRGPCSHPKKFKHALGHNSWEPESNLSVEVLNEYWDGVAKPNNMLTRHGVKCDRKTPIAHKHLR